MDPHDGSAFRTKATVRDFVWRLLEEAGAGRFPFPLRGRIPNFAGSPEAAAHLRTLRAFGRARVVFCAPDYAVKAARDLVLAEGKTLAFAMPHMTAFLEMEGAGRPTSIRAMGRAGRPLASPIDLKVSGCVAVDLKGNRIGKGTGYGDQEVATLRDWGLLPAGPFPFITLCHGLQLFDDLSHLVDAHDVPVTAIATPEGILPVGEGRE
ncbi:MAG: 5-formyltetrahydrofolate cyclo-ligase [Candidatus Tectimicrobiota bacterium]